MSILDDLRATIEQAKPIVYYSTSDQIPTDKGVRIAAQGMYPEHWIFHPDTFEQRKAELAQRARLVHFRDWEPTPEQRTAEEARIIEDLGKWARESVEKRLREDFAREFGIRPRWQ